MYADLITIYAYMSTAYLTIFSVLTLTKSLAINKIKIDQKRCISVNMVRNFPIKIYYEL